LSGTVAFQSGATCQGSLTTAVKANSTGMPVATNALHTSSSKITKVIGERQRLRPLEVLKNLTHAAIRGQVRHHAGDRRVSTDLPVR